METAVEFVLLKTKKPISVEKVYKRVAKVYSGDEDYELSDAEKNLVDEIIEEGVKNYDYIKTPSNNLISIKKTSFAKGVFIGNRNGYGSVMVTDSYMKNGKLVTDDKKYNISKDNVNGAIDGDIVLIDVGDDKKSAPKIVNVIKRNLVSIVGEVEKVGNTLYVRPADKKNNINVVIEDDSVVDGQKVAVNLKKQTNSDFYIGEVTHVFNKYEPDDDILYEALKCGVVADFSEEALKQASDIPQKVLDCDKIGRSDFTDWQIFTIDGKDTKDIDDALSIQVLDNGNYLVGVHIADVSHYVKEDSPLDMDAYSKGTSVYLGGKVIPMLPPELSNGICSLNPNVERLAISCLMEIDKDGKIVRHDLRRSVIRSGKQMNYDAVNDILKNGKVEHGYEEYVDSLKLLNELATTLRENRLRKGAIEFERSEIHIDIAENGELDGFSLRTQDLAEDLIEEFMLAANETVDKHLCDRGFPCLHRVHGKPNKERLTEFLNMLRVIGYKYDENDPISICDNNHKFQDLASHIKDTGSLYNMLSTNLVRCMSRAKYSNINIGHSGLAKENYCHFTSPIRRYPDLTIHRILDDCCFDKDISKKDKWKVSLPTIALQSSKMERVADDAEVETLAMRCAEYMEDHIGEDFIGTIIGIGRKGIQVQLDNFMEGKVRFRNLVGKYEFNPDTYSLVSLSGQDNYHIGDRLSLKLVEADKESKLIDFKVNNKLEENLAKSSRLKNEFVKQKKLEYDKLKRTYNML